MDKSERTCQRKMPNQIYLNDGPVTQLTSFGLLETFWSDKYLHSLRRSLGSKLWSQEIISISNGNSNSGVMRPTTSKLEIDYPITSTLGKFIFFENRWKEGYAVGNLMERWRFEDQLLIGWCNNQDAKPKRRRILGLSMASPTWPICDWSAKRDAENFAWIHGASCVKKWMAIKLFIWRRIKRFIRQSQTRQEKRCYQRCMHPEQNRKWQKDSDCRS